MLDDPCRGREGATESALVRMERRLAEEARRWKNDVMEMKTGPGRINGLFEHLGLGEKGEPKADNTNRYELAEARLQAIIRQERRAGAAGSPLYNLGRHIAARQALNRLRANRAMPDDAGRQEREG